MTTIRARLERRHGVHITAIWGGRPTESEVGPAIYRDFLPEALRTGRYRATPDRLRRRIGTRRDPRRPGRAPRRCLRPEARRHAPLSR
ncbi:hypothetical protein Q9Q99_07645 [Curtobacterium flaccumfaciens]|nr:hypothetical protein Q9Q99_07645 [Curtobacterium flaccumfaciens]